MEGGQRGLTVTQVQYVLEVAACKNISRAAERLFISQSALSQQIRRLEHELGFPLFTRTARGLELTEDGVVFCREAQPAVEAWMAFHHAVVSMGKPKNLRLRIVVGARVYSNGLFPDIVRFFDAHPDMEAVFVTEAGRDYLADLRNGTIDLALDRLPSEDYLDKRPEFYTRELVRERQCVLTSPQDPRAACASLTLQDLQGCAMISGLENSAEDRILKETCKQFNIAFRRVYRSDGIETSMNLVRSGRGVVLGPQSFAEYYRVAAVTLVPGEETALRFICLRGNLKRREVHQFLSHLLSVCAAYGFLDGGGEGNLNTPD